MEHPYSRADEERRRFRRQTRSVLTVLVILLAINVITSPGNWWIQWPALGLGIALAMRYKRMQDAREDADAVEGVAGAAAPADDDLTRRAEALAARERGASGASL